MFAANSTDDEKSRFIDGLGRDFYQVGITPQRLRVYEIDAVFLPVGAALSVIELETRYGIDFIPLFNLLQRTPWASVLSRSASSGSMASGSEAGTGTTWGDDDAGTLTPPSKVQRWRRL